MAEVDEQANEKQEIQDYLKLYALEECLDEIMNDVVIERPRNPYVRIGHLFEIKTLPEIINVDFRPILLGGSMAVQAFLTTNIATFSAVSPYEQTTAEELPTSPKDYSAIQEKIKDAIIDINPVDVAKFDDCVANLAGIDPAESLALSIACCKAAARHKALPLHRFIAELSGLKIDDMVIPVPVVSVLSRVIEGSEETQDVTLTPVRAGSFGSALQKVLEASALVSRNEEIVSPKAASRWGSPCVSLPNVHAAVRLVRSVLQNNDLTRDLKMGIHFRSAHILKQPIDPENPVYAYNMDGASGAASSGSDAVESLTSLWQEAEFISADEILFEADQASLQLMQKRVKETIYDLKESNSEVLKYNTFGVGGDSTCCLQVMLDAASFGAIKDLEHFSQTMPYNCVKLQLSKFPNLSQLIELVRRARAAGWALALSSNDSATHAEPMDTFLADLAVGVGAGQLLSGGMLSAEGYAKYNRLVELQREEPAIPFVGEKFRLSVRQ